RPHSSLPNDVFVGAKVNGRSAFADSRGIRSSKLRPPRLGAVLRRADEARQNDGCQKSDQRSSYHDGFLFGFHCENRGNACCAYAATLVSATSIVEMIDGRTLRNIIFSHRRIVENRP